MESISDISALTSEFDFGEYLQQISWERRASDNLTARLIRFVINRIRAKSIQGHLWIIQVYVLFLQGNS